MTAQADSSLSIQLAQLETKHEILKERVDNQEAKTEGMRERLTSIDVSIGKTKTELTWIKWVLLVGVPGLLVLQGWELFAR